MISKKVKELKDWVGYPSVDGSFFSYYHGYACSCREEFHDTQNKPGWVGFGKTKVDIKNVHAFWMELEKRLGIKRSTFHPTDAKDWIMIKVNPWWNRNRLRQEVMTVMLRGSTYATRENFWGCLTYDYARQTERALRLFVDGWTSHKGVFQYGFVYSMGGIGEETLRKDYLIKR